MKQNFLDAINNKLLVQITDNSRKKNLVVRKCVPFDYGPSEKYKDGLDRYHFYGLNSADGIHNISILPSQLMKLTVLDQSFDPAEYVTWSPTKWIVSRDWGIYS